MRTVNTTIAIFVNGAVLRRRDARLVAVPHVRAPGHVRAHGHALARPDERLHFFAL